MNSCILSIRVILTSMHKRSKRNDMHPSKYGEKGRRVTISVGDYLTPFNHSVFLTNFSQCLYSLKQSRKKSKSSSLKPSSQVIPSKQPTSASSSLRSNVPSKQPTSLKQSASSSSSKSNLPLAGDLQRPVADRTSSKKRKRDDDSLALVQSAGKGNCLVLV